MKLQDEAEGEVVSWKEGNKCPTKELFSAHLVCGKEKFLK